ncbi:hypothetical protein QBC40DRAFT_171895 [Triangularia verruculosa]|uniref:Uncharacterized protein n=1 Tax=Triangularia verruculosa TaxID=2587418 RepID=A0AAN7AW57_9PEZI|nr:hypothetical protein QBC40DRAFT_171895 [Triangularia verruculosa]
MTATASRKKKHNPRANDDRRRSDRPERSRHTRSMKERPHDRVRHTDPIEKPLNYAPRHHLPDDRADPGERVRDWVQRTQDRHSHRSLPTAPNSDEKLRRMSPPRYRSADIIRGKKRGRSVSRSPSVSLNHEPSGGRADTRFEKRRRHKTYEDKYEYKGDINRRKQPSKELRVEPKPKPNSRDVADGREPTRGPLTIKQGREPQHSSSSSRFIERRYGPNHRSPVLPSRPTRQCISAHPQDPHYESGPDDSYFTSSSRTDTVTQERRGQYQHLSREAKSYEQVFVNDGWPGNNSMSHRGEINHIMPSVEKPQAASPPIQPATPLVSDRPKHGGTDAIPPHPQNIVTIVLPRYKDVETQTDPSLLGGLRGPMVEIAEAINQPVDMTKQAYCGPEIQKRIQLLPDSPYPDTKPSPLDEMNREPPRQHYTTQHQEAKDYAFEQTPGRAQDLAGQRYQEESFLNTNVHMPSEHYGQAHSANYISGGSQPRYLSRYHTPHSQLLNTNTCFDGKQIEERRLNNLIQQHEGRPPAIIVVGSQRLAQRLAQKVRFQEPRPTVPTPGGPYMEDVDDFISRIEEENLRESGTTSVVEENEFPVKTEEYDEFGELEYERLDTVQDGKSGHYEPIVGFGSPGGNWDTESLVSSRRNGAVGHVDLRRPRTPEMISRPPVTPRHMAQAGADVPFTGRRSGTGQVSVRPWRYGESYEI